MCDPVPSSSSSVPPSGSSDSATNTARKRGKSAAEKRDTANRLHVLDSHMRINFLHQGAMFLSCQSSGLDDGYAKLSRRYAKLLRDVLKTERVKIKPDIGQTFCRKCHQVFVCKTERCTLNLIQRKVLQRKCKLCGQTRNYEWNVDHLSRNERLIG